MGILLPSTDTDVSDQNIYGVINDLKEKLKCADIGFIHKQVIKVMDFEDIRIEWIFF